MAYYTFENIPATPYAKVLARKEAIDISSVPMPDRGYLTGQDILEYAESLNNILYKYISEEEGDIAEQSTDESVPEFAETSEPGIPANPNPDNESIAGTSDTTEATSETNEYNIPSCPDQESEYDVPSCPDQESESDVSSSPASNDSNEENISEPEDGQDSEEYAEDTDSFESVGLVSDAEPQAREYTDENEYEIDEPLDEDDTPESCEEQNVSDFGDEDDDSEHSGKRLNPAFSWADLFEPYRPESEPTKAGGESFAEKHESSENTVGENSETEAETPAPVSTYKDNMSSEFALRWAQINAPRSESASEEKEPDREMANDEASEPAEAPAPEKPSADTQSMRMGFASIRLGKH